MKRGSWAWNAAHCNARARAALERGDFAQAKYWRAQEALCRLRARAEES